MMISIDHVKVNPEQNQKRVIKIRSIANDRLSQKPTHPELKAWNQRLSMKTRTGNERSQSTLSYNPNLKDKGKKSVSATDQKIADVCLRKRHHKGNKGPARQAARM